MQMLSIDKLDRHQRLDSVTLRYENGIKTVYYEWKDKGDWCWATRDGKVYLPADAASLALTAFFQHEVVVESPQEQRILYIRMKQLKDVASRETSKLWVQVNGGEALAGDEQRLLVSL